MLDWMVMTWFAGPRLPGRGMAQDGGFRFRFSSKLKMKLSIYLQIFHQSAFSAGLRNPRGSILGGGKSHRHFRTGRSWAASQAPSLVGNHWAWSIGMMLGLPMPKGRIISLGASHYRPSGLAREHLGLLSSQPLGPSFARPSEEMRLAPERSVRGADRRSSFPRRGCPGSLLTPNCGIAELGGAGARVLS